MTNYSTYTDIELMDLLKSGDQAAFTAIYKRHWKFLFNGVFKATGHREDSMDICQTVFIWLWEKREVVQISSSLKNYLHTAVKYKIANLIRQGKIRETLFDELEEVDFRVYKENELEIKELKCFIAQLVDELPPKCKEVFQLSRNEQLSHKEIAEKLGISEKTVDEQIHRALKKLRVPLGRLVVIFLISEILLS